MINAANLLADLKRLRKPLDADLRVMHAAGAQRDAVYAEWREAFDQGRTRDTFQVFLDGAFDQSVVHWILGCVFLRFLEDNLLVDRPFISGPSDRLELAKERQDAHFRARPHDSDAEYLHFIFAEAAQLPGLAGLYDPVHNPLFRLPLSGDGAMALIRFFRELLPESGELTHDFTDPEWDTRFLGDLYQDLSEEARKRYALLQTPEFVEEWILDRTLEPAIREFGHERVTMIDPACGSGHFLLGGFDRLLRDWRRFAPSLPPAEQAQRALSAIAGVDLNPFAVEIARFRLLVAALLATGVHRLSSAPSFRMHLAAGDSLLHGRHFFRHELGGAEEGFGRTLRHHYATEDTAEIDRILGRQYHAVVGNPPYITPKDAAMRVAYREIYLSCHMKYGLGAPFIERFFDLALAGSVEPAGFVGLIVANSFMKREFGKKLIEEVLPRLDLTHVIDCSGAYIPGHGTPTVIMFGRNRLPPVPIVRMVMGVRGEPAAPVNPATAHVWTAIVEQTDIVDSASEFVTVSDIQRSVLSRHPWSTGGGGVSELKTLIEQAASKTLGDISSSIGFGVILGIDSAFEFSPSDLNRLGIPLEFQREFVMGDYVQDWHIVSRSNVLFPYDEEFRPTLPDQAKKMFWPLRELLYSRNDFSGKTFKEAGRSFFEYHQFPVDRYKAKGSIVFPFVATHVSFCFDDSSAIYNKTSPIVKLIDPAGALGVLGLLNSSVGSFWMKQVFFNKGAGGGTRVEAGRAPLGDENWENHYEHDGTKLARFPITSNLPNEIVEKFLVLGAGLTANVPARVIAHHSPSADDFASARGRFDAFRARSIALQEELDWQCYRLYGLTEMSLEHQDPPLLNLGERAFEIVMAREMAAGTLETAWFTRNASVPITDLPAHWSPDYRSVVEERIALIGANATIGLIERPEYKRRWSMDSWDGLESSALETWLLEQLEDPAIWSGGDTRLISTNQLADLVRRNEDFLAAAALYEGQDVNIEALVADLVAKQSVPFLAALRYADTGLRKHVLWKETWEIQRREDRIDAEVASHRDEFRAEAERRAQQLWRDTNRRQPSDDPESYAIRVQAGALEATEEMIDRLIIDEQRQRKSREIGDIPVPPKYIAKDFQSTDFWRLRGGLDIPKERFVSFPHCQRDADGSLVVTWAGHNHLERALAIAAYYQERKDSEGWPPERLVPLLAGVIELLPWLLQWHNDYDSDLGARMGDYFVDFVQTEARALGMTEAAVAAWTPPATPRRGRSRRIAA
jgi:hypothetical protein